MKIPYWETSFFTYIEVAETRPFLWGSFDCCLFVAGAAEALTGVDVTADFPPAYDNEAGAIAYLESLGGLAALFDAAFLPLGAVKVLPLYAKRGDIFLLELPGSNGIELMGAVCTGRDVVFLTEQGFRAIVLPGAAKLGAQVWGFK